MKHRRHPSILLITADQLRYDALGCAGNEVVQTPHLDALAKSGVLFTSCYTPNPICVPARASITTGNYSHRATGTKNNTGLIRDGQNKIAEVFNEAGYETYAVGKLHYVPYAPLDRPKLLHGFRHAELAEEGRIIRQYDPEGKRRGVEEYFDYLRDVGWGGYSRAHGIGNNDLRPAASCLPEEHCVDAWVATRIIEHLKPHLEKDRDRPFLMWASFVKPHSPCDPPHPYDRMYDPRNIPKPLGDADMALTRSPYSRVTAARHGLQYLSPEAVQLFRAHYYGLVTFQDRMVGRLIGFLDAERLRDETIILYASDHGDLIGDFGGCFKCSFQEGSVHVPLIMSAPGRIPSGKVCGELAGLQDILPTIAAMAGVELKYPVDGKDLSPMIGGRGGVRDIYVSQCLESPWQMYMAYDGQWKYAYHEAHGFEELYDLVDDPHELHNLASEAEAQGHASRLQNEIIRWCAENADKTMLDGGSLRMSSVDVEAECRFNADAMGWRWY